MVYRGWKSHDNIHVHVHLRYVCVNMWICTHAHQHTHILYTYVHVINAHTHTNQTRHYLAGFSSSPCVWWFSFNLLDLLDPSRACLWPAHFNARILAHSFQLRHAALQNTLKIHSHFFRDGAQAISHVSPLPSTHISVAASGLRCRWSGGVCRAEEPPGHGAITAGGLARSGGGGAGNTPVPTALAVHTPSYSFCVQDKYSRGCMFCVSPMPRDAEWLFVCCSLAAGTLLWDNCLSTSLATV